MNEKMLEKAVEYLDAVESTLDQYGPEVADATLWVVRLRGVGDVITGVVWLIGFAVCIWLSQWLMQRSRSALCDEAEPLIVMSWAVKFASAGPFVVSMIHLLSIWTWVAIFEPKLWLVKEALKRLL